MPTLSDHAVRRLTALCRAVGYTDDEARPAADLTHLLTRSFGRRDAAAPPWPSDLTDDGTPFEASVTFGGPRPEVRLLVEVQGDEPRVEAHWRAARSFARELRDAGVATDRFDEVADLFAPAPGARFGLWFAAVLPADGRPLVKAYLNPQAQDPQAARARVGEALRRLGLGDAALPDGELGYLALDLTDERPRVKVYLLLPSTDPDRIEGVLALARDRPLRAAADFCACLGGPGPYSRRPVVASLTFLGGDPRPDHGTVHFPIRSYVSDDEVARDRILAVLDPADREPYRAALDVFAERPLHLRPGLQTYASLRVRSGRRRVTAYLAPELGAPR